MLLPDNVHPADSIYYNGAFVLQAIQENLPQNTLDLYFSAKRSRNMSMPVFVLCLDWLFILNLIALNDQGKVELCS